MSRPTTEIVADLRNEVPPVKYGLRHEAADRLAEQEAEIERLNKVVDELMEPGASMSDYPHNALSLLVQSSRVSPPLRAAVAEVEAYLAELDAEVKQIEGQFDDCWKDLQRLDALRPTCPTCGSTTVIGTGLMAIDCPDCEDGRVSIERLVNVFNAVFQDWPEDHLPPTIIHLRSIR